MTTTHSTSVMVIESIIAQQNLQPYPTHSTIYTFEGGHTWHHLFHGPKAGVSAQNHRDIFGPLATIDYCGLTQQAPTALLLKAGHPILEL